MTSGRSAASTRSPIEAWAPLAQGAVLGDPTIDSIARRVGKTPAQVVLRWHIERGDIVFPKSVTPARIKENIDIFDFELSGEDVEAISALNRDDRTGPNPDKFDWLLTDPRRPNPSRSSASYLASRAPGN